MKYQKGIVFVLILLSICRSVTAEKVATFQDIFAPSTICVNSERIYISQKCTIYMFSLKDYSFIKKCGQKGTGPAEFPFDVWFYADDNRLVASSGGGIFFFSTTGDFISQSRVNAFSFEFYSLGTRVVAQNNLSEKDVRFLSINLYEQENRIFNKSKELYRYKRGIQPKGDVNLISFSASSFVYDNKIFFNDEKGLLQCYDGEGKKIKTIDPGIKPIPFSSADKKKYLAYTLSSKVGKIFYDMHKNRLKFSSHWPPMKSFFAVDHMLYVITYKPVGTSFECLIFDLNGNRLKKTVLPVVYDEYMMDPYPFCIKNGKVYQLIENDECWDLHVTAYK